jgi:exodeoxyribonuclease VII small subunit
MTAKKENLGYDEAIGRLEKIVKNLEEDDQGMDDLTDMVKEASQLVKLCKKKLKMTTEEITKAFDEEQ